MARELGLEGGALEWVSGCASELSAGAEAIASAHPASGICVQDAGGAIVGANARAAELLGLTWEQLIGRTSMDARWSSVAESGLPLTGDQHPAMVTLATGKVVSGFLMGVMAPIDVGDLGRMLGRARWIEITSHPVLAGSDDGAAVRGVVAVFDDATDSARGHRASDRQWMEYQLVIQNADDVVLRTDALGTVRWVSLSVDRELGWRPADLVDRGFDDLIHPDDRGRLGALRDLMRVQSEDERAARAELRFALPDGGWTWVSDAGRLIFDRDLNGSGELHTMRDITSEIAGRQALAESEQRYRLLAENATDVVVRVSDDVIVWASPSITATMGGTVGEWVGRSIRDIIRSDDWDESESQVTGLDADSSIVTRFRSTDTRGREHWLEAHTRRYVGPDGERDGYIASIRVVDTIVAAEETLARQARYDSLTGLLNRSEAMGAVDRLMSGERRGGDRVAVLFCDLDGFKSVNDHYGHAAGDEVLRVVADRIQTRIRKGDLAARIGGDELLVVLVGVHDVDDALSIAEDVRAAAALPIQVNGRPVSTTISVGVAMAEAGESVDDLVARADGAMYEAKANGRDQVVALAHR